MVRNRGSGKGGAGQWLRGRARAIAAAPASSGQQHAPYVLAAVLLPMFFFLYGLDAFPLRDNNEGLYAEIAREMLAGGNIVVPHLNGVPYIEKPPLLYWLCALSMRLFGATPAAVRLVPAGSMLALCLGVFQFCRMYGKPRAGCFASVMLASALPVALVSHVVLFDPLLTALFGASLLCWLHGYLAGKRWPGIVAAFLLGLAVLDKGGVALVLAGGTVGLFLVLVRDRAGWRRLFDPAALGVLVLTAGSWHVAAALRQPGFTWFYFINEHLLRFLGHRVPDDYHYGPLWFYLPRLLVMLLPWTPMLLLLARGRAASGGGPQAAIVRFCQAAVLFPLLFFSISAAKADYYLIVALPPLALWLGLELAQRTETPDRLLALCWSGALVLALLAWGVFPGVLDADMAPAALGWWCAAAVLLAAAGRRIFLALRARPARDRALLGVALVAMLALPPMYRIADQRGLEDSSVYVARILAQHKVPRSGVFIYRDFEDKFSTLPFYLGHPVPVVDSRSRDLQFGCRSAPGAFCVGAGAIDRARHRGEVAVVLDAELAPEFLARERGPWRAELAGPRMVLFASPCPACAPGKTVAFFSRFPAQQKK